MPELRQRFGGRNALAGLCAATLAGIFSATQFGGGFLILGVWMGFAFWISSRSASQPATSNVA